MQNVICEMTSQLKDNNGDENSCYANEIGSFPPHEIVDGGILERNSLLSNEGNEPSDEVQWLTKGTTIHTVDGISVVGVDDESEIFRSVWKYYKRNSESICNYVRACEMNNVITGNLALGTHKKRPRVGKVPCLDFYNLHNSPTKLANLVQPISLRRTSDNDVENMFLNRGIECSTAFTIPTRPGFAFIPNPFKSADYEAYWAGILALSYPGGPSSQCNEIDGKSKAIPLDPGLRWATLGFHYDWKNRLYSEENQNPFPSELAQLTLAILGYIGDSVVGKAIVPETAIINYYKKGKTMGGHKDDAEWTDEAPVVSMSFGNAGIYVLGGNSQNDRGPPPPLPLIVRSGDILLLGGPSRMNIHGVPCFLPNTSPKRLQEAILRDKSNFETFLPPKLKTEADTTLSVVKRFAQYMSETRINVNIRQVRSNKAILSLAKRVAT